MKEEGARQALNQQFKDFNTSMMESSQRLLKVTRKMVKRSFKQRFKKLRKQWQSETRNNSSPAMILSNQAHLEMLTMGSEIVPLIMKRLRKGDNLQWWATLTALTGENLTVAYHGQWQSNADSWLDWWDKKQQRLKELEEE